MTAAYVVAERADRVADLIEKKLGIRGQGLERKVRNAGRVLPRWVRREADALIEARRMADHPKLARRVDRTRVDRAAKACERWLMSVDPSKRRMDKVLSLLAVNAFNLLLIGTLLIIYLVRAGYV